MYSGVSTVFLAQAIKNIIINFKNLSGLFQLAPDASISKYDLLCIAKKTYGLDIGIIPDDTYVHLPTLDGSKLKDAIHLDVPLWEEMMEELALNDDNYLDN